MEVTQFKIKSILPITLRTLPEFWSPALCRRFHWHRLVDASRTVRQVELYKNGDKAPRSKIRATLWVNALLLILLFIGLKGFAMAEPASSDFFSKRVHAHMVIGDYPSACLEAFAGVQCDPSSKILWQSYLRALAKMGDERILMSNWKAFINRFPNEQTNREMLECLAWAAIESGAHSMSPPIRIMALLGAFFSQDAKGVALLREGLRDNNSFLRFAALKLSSRLQDTTLQEEVFRLFKTENVWRVRLAAIEALGSLRVEKAREDLLMLVAHERSSAEEKAAALEALVAMSKRMGREYIKAIVQSNRAGMRLLGCELLAFFEQTEDLDLLLPLVNDSHSNVRAKALHTFGILKAVEIGGRSIASIAESKIDDTDPLVALTAAWLLTLHDPFKGSTAFEPFFCHENGEIRQLASAALAGTGKYGLPLLKRIFATSRDLYVRMNLAIGLIGQREEVMAACDCLYQGMEQQKEKWMCLEECHFQALMPSKLKHDEAIPNYPEAINQLVRLKILEMLAAVQYPHAQRAVKNFLKERNWGISGMASALLLTEGDEEAIDLVKGLLEDSNEQIRIQSALILALWGRGEDAVQVLQEAYASADKELKGQILEGLGRVGSATSLQFLTERLLEPHQTLRIIAASALLECLYH